MKDDHSKKDEVTHTSNRKRAIEILKSGKKKKEVVAVFGVVPNTISNWVKRHKDRGTKTGLKLWAKIGKFASENVMADYLKSYNEIIPNK